MVEKANRFKIAAASALVLSCGILVTDLGTFRWVEAIIAGLGFFGFVLMILEIAATKGVTFEGLVYDIVVGGAKWAWGKKDIRVGGPGVERLEEGSPTDIPSNGRGLNIGRYGKGMPAWLDPYKMHHAGVFALSGGGKTTFLHTLIHQVSLAYSPDEVQLAISDLKEVSFRIFENSPFLKFPVAKAAETPLLLHMLDEELAHRKRLFSLLPSERLCENVADYQRLCNELEMDLEPLPVLLIIIDEVQELYAFKGASEIVTRIAKQGRAFGMKLILCTQRPTSVGLSHEVQAQLDVRFVGSMTTNKEYSVAQVPKEVYEREEWKNSTADGQFLILQSGEWKIVQVLRIRRDLLEMIAGRLGEVTRQHPEFAPRWAEEGLEDSRSHQDMITDVQADIDDEDGRTRLTGSSEEKIEQVVIWLQDGGYDEKPSVREFQETFIAAKHTSRKWLSTAWALYQGEA